jgi:hypothetical protein
MVGFSLVPWVDGQLFTVKDGVMRSTWETLGVIVAELKVDKQCGAAVDWLK